MSSDLMEEGEATPDAGKASCDTGMTKSPLDLNGKDVHGNFFGMEAEDSQIVKNAQLDDRLGLHVAGGMHGLSLPPPNDVCMGVRYRSGAGQSSAFSLGASMQGVCDNASPTWKQPDKVSENMSSSPNPWNARNPAWKKPSVVPLLSSAELGQFTIEETTVILDDEEVETTLKIFEFAIVGRMFGRRIPYSVLSSELSRKWADMGRFRLIMLSRDCFVCIFETLEAREAVFGGGPWVILGQVLGVNRWSSSFSPATLDGFRTPIWIRMPGLPLYCWGSKNISRIVALVGEPLWVDAATNQIDRGLFARACVQIDLSEPLKTGVWIQGRHGKFFQKVEYEGLSVFCYRCCHVGHKASACKMPSACRGADVTPPPSPERSILPSNQASPSTSLPREPPPNRGGEDIAAGLLNDDQGAGPWMMVHRKRRSSKIYQRGSYLQPDLNLVPYAMHTNRLGAGMGVGNYKSRGSLNATVRQRSALLDKPSHGSRRYDLAHQLEEAKVQDRGCMKHWDGEYLNEAGRDYVTQCEEVLQVTELKLAEPQMEEGKSVFINSSANAIDSEMEKQVNEQQLVDAGEEAQHVGDEHVNERQYIELEMEGWQPTFTGFSALPLGEVGSAFVSVTAKAHSRGGKIRGAKKEKMVCDLGPVAPGSRKRRKAQSISDGGDASPSPPS